MAAYNLRPTTRIADFGVKTKQEFRIALANQMRVTENTYPYRLDGLAHA